MKLKHYAYWIEHLSKQVLWDHVSYVTTHSLHNIQSSTSGQNNIITPEVWGAARKDIISERFSTKKLLNQSDLAKPAHIYLNLHTFP